MMGKLGESKDMPSVPTKRKVRPKLSPDEAAAKVAATRSTAKLEDAGSTAASEPPTKKQPPSDSRELRGVGVSFDEQFCLRREEETTK